MKRAKGKVKERIGRVFSTSLTKPERIGLVGCLLNVKATASSTDLRKISTGIFLPSAITSYMLSP